MSKYTEAADVLKREAARSKALIAAAETLESLGSIDQAAKEATAALAAARGELETVLKGVVSAKADAARIVSDAKVAAEALAESAQSQKADAIKAAGIEADRLKSNAVETIKAEQERAEKMLQAFDAKIATANSVLAGLNGDIARATEAAAVANDDAKTAEARLEKALAKIRSMVS